MDNRLEKLNQLLPKVQKINKSITLDKEDLESFQELVDLFYKIPLINASYTMKGVFKPGEILLEKLTIIELIKLARSIYSGLENKNLNLKPLKKEMEKLDKIEKSVKKEIDLLTGTIIPILQKTK